MFNPPKGDRIFAGLRQPEQAVVKQEGRKPEGLSLGECQALQEEAQQVSAAAKTICTRQKAFLRKGKQTAQGEEQPQATSEKPTEEKEQEMEQTLCWTGWVRTASSS